MTWNSDMSAAPRDGSYILLATTRDVAEGFWNAKALSPCWYVSRDEQVGEYGDQPTHWMPLPPPPTGDTP